MISLRVGSGLLLTILASPYAIVAQHTGVSLATLGMVFDPSARGIRPITGVPGAALTGPCLDVGFSIGQAVASPSQNYALALRSDDSELRLVVRSQGVISVHPVPGAQPGPDRMVLSPTGGAAALYYGGGQTIQVIDGLPNTPVPAKQIDASALPGPLTALAVSDDGLMVLAGTSGTNGGSIYALTPGGTARQIAQLQEATAVAFLKGSHNAWVVDRLQNTVFQWQGSGGGQFTTIATEAQGISGPIAAESSLDGQRLIVANSASGTVSSIGLANSQTAQVKCNCRIAGLARLTGSSVFALTQPADGTILWVFDGDVAAPRIVFVPAQTQPRRQESSPEPVAPGRRDRP